MSLQVCKYCGGHMLIRKGPYGLFVVCAKRSCGWIPSKTEEREKLLAAENASIIAENIRKKRHKT